MNIVLLVLDTVRGDVVEQLLDRGELPNIRNICQSGTRYTDARTNGPWTVPSHGAIFTGKYPRKSGIHGGDPTYESVPLVDELNHRGYKTAAFSANPWLSEGFQFNEPFDVFHDSITYDESGASVRKLFGIREHPRESITRYLHELRKSNSNASVRNIVHWAKQAVHRQDSGGEFLLSQATTWLQREDERFAFINVTEPHLQYQLPDSWLPEGVNSEVLKSVQQDTVAHNAGVQQVSEQDIDILRRTYEATIRYLDHRIGDLVERVPDDTVFIITGDHGEHFGEHERFGHQYSVHEELLHVPLIVSGPGIDHGTVDRTVELRSLYEFILGLADGEVTPPAPVDYHFAEIVSPTPTVEMLEQKGSGDIPSYVRKYGGGARCVSADGTTVVEFPDGELDVLSGSREQIESLQRAIHETLGKPESVGQANLDVSESIEEQLGDLGYL